VADGRRSIKEREKPRQDDDRERYATVTQPRPTALRDAFRDNTKLLLLLVLGDVL